MHCPVRGENRLSRRQPLATDSGIYREPHGFFSPDAAPDVRCPPLPSIAHTHMAQVL